MALLSHNENGRTERDKQASTVLAPRVYFFFIYTFYIDRAYAFNICNILKTPSNADLCLPGGRGIRSSAEETNKIQELEKTIEKIQKILMPIVELSKN